MKLFKIRCSQIGKIMGRVGLTEIQEAKLKELSEREITNMPKPLTPAMVKELAKLREEKNNPKLPDTCQTYLKEWYANDIDETHSKYFDKGNMVEMEVIEMAADKLGFGFADKNQISMDDEYFTGTCDVDLPYCVIDTKAPWNKKTLNDAATEDVDTNYIWQGRGYMRLYNRQEYYIFYGLVDTPEEANYGTEVSFAHIPENERWVAYKLKRDVTIEQEIIARVIECRKWLAEYDVRVKSRLGKVIEI